MRYFSIILFIFSCCFAANGQWTTLDSGTNEWLRGVWFMNEEIGIAVGNNGTILRTVDSGDSWQKIESNTTANLWSVFFPSEDIGYVTGSNAMILKSIDGGLSWEVIKEELGNETIYESFFLSNELGYVSGSGGNILKTTDGGLNWNTIFLEGQNSSNSVYFINDTVGYFGGNNIEKTIDGGNTTSISHTTFLSTITSLYFTNINNGYACSNFGNEQFIRTTDGGQTWVTQNIDYDGGIHSIKFTGPQDGLIVGGFEDASIILSTNDGGDNWIEEDTETDNPLFEIFMFSYDYAFVVGQTGTILRKRNVVSTLDYSKANYEVFPNPTLNCISIKIPNADQVNYEIYNLAGMKLKSGTTNNSDCIDVAELLSGQYVINLQNEEVSFSYKIIKN